MNLLEQRQAVERHAEKALVMIAQRLMDPSIITMAIERLEANYPVWKDQGMWQWPLGRLEVNLREELADAVNYTCAAIELSER